MLVAKRKELKLCPLSDGHIEISISNNYKPERHIRAGSCLKVLEKSEACFLHWAISVSTG